MENNELDLQVGESVMRTQQPILDGVVRVVAPEMGLEILDPGKVLTFSGQGPDTVHLTLLGTNRGAVISRSYWTKEYFLPTNTQGDYVV